MRAHIMHHHSPVAGVYSVSAADSRHSRHSDGHIDKVTYLKFALLQSLHIVDSSGTVRCCPDLSLLITTRVSIGAH